ncbi:MULTISPECIES: imidazole glycerol phosphate synthase subunit HisH [unclassified Candidatus Frackibacter]|uniref:imidazole glycerol phosphate synthase subunit HisH n=1 Tax=unclassified Candidatus Frackibacter TaxID=2648818 RepID=UPI0008875E09|nr:MULTISPECIES: imidazole glycerol phosphate synthase subunit HisH [unclassified Candidatus Frackibacter]SDC51383.1 glutamine amidotransferase [Candidatus Frackibacter sp. WG11]SEM40865.1 glutamine amidotransferase [Candidatus Frackibacter sp. WG12]SFL75427.1 glutamine amidotransferase [Candidatus Frackibacter sp. WG13]
MIAIIDYGMGNLRSVQKGFEKVGVEAQITSDADEILEADGVVLPGVGAFGDAMDNLDSTGLIPVIKKVVNKGTPFLGICLGLHLLFSTSEEWGTQEGLDIISGNVVKFPSDLDKKIPHMGWNQLEIKKETEIFKGLESGTFQYFVHSYYVLPDDEEVVATTTDYGIEFVSSIQKDNIYAVQYHPEKSSQKGLQILRNFGELI